MLFSSVLTKKKNTTSSVLNLVKLYLFIIKAVRPPWGTAPGPSLSCWRLFGAKRPGCPEGQIFKREGEAMAESWGGLGGPAAPAISAAVGNPLAQWERWEATGFPRFPRGQGVFSTAERATGHSLGCPAPQGPAAVIQGICRVWGSLEEGSTNLAKPRRQAACHRPAHCLAGAGGRFIPCAHCLAGAGGRAPGQAHFLAG